MVKSLKPRSLKEILLILRLPPQATEKKKKKKANKVGHIKAADTGLEGFVDWVDPISSEQVEERKGDMSSLVVGFFVRMRKWAVSAQGKTTPDSEVSGGKCPKLSGLDEEAQKSLAVITVDSPKQAFDSLPVLEGAAQDASKEACASLENGAPTEGPPNADQVVREAPSVEMMSLKVIHF